MNIFDALNVTKTNYEKVRDLRNSNDKLEATFPKPSFSVENDPFWKNMQVISEAALIMNTRNLDRALKEYKLAEHEIKKNSEKSHENTKAEVKFRAFQNATFNLNLFVYKTTMLISDMDDTFVGYIKGLASKKSKNKDFQLQDVMSVVDENVKASSRIYFNFISSAIDKQSILTKDARERLERFSNNIKDLDKSLSELFQGGYKDTTIIDNSFADLISMADKVLRYPLDVAHNIYDFGLTVANVIMKEK